MGKKGGIRLRWRGSQEALREQEAALAQHPQRPKAVKQVKGKKAKKRKGRRQEREPAIARQELVAMHARVKGYCLRNDCRPGSEGYSLLCQLGAAMGNWPRVKRTLADTMRRRVAALFGETAVARPVRTPDEKEDRQGLPCCRCERATSADDLTCLHGSYWVCPQCRNVHEMVATRSSRGG